MRQTARPSKHRQQAAPNFGGKQNALPQTQENPQNPRRTTTTTTKIPKSPKRLVIMHHAHITFSVDR